MSFKLLLILFIPTLVFLNSCGKKPNPPEATVMVVIEEADGSETPVSGAIVRLYSNPNGSYIEPDSLVLESTQTTNEVGHVRFITENDCILSIDATYTDDDDFVFFGKSVLIFEKNKIYEKTLEIK